jgi:hypothetical protein
MIGCLFTVIILIVMFFSGVLNYVVYIIGLASVFYLPFLFIKRILFRRRAIKVEAVIVDYVIKNGSRPTPYYPILEYTVPEYGLVRTVGTTPKFGLDYKKTGEKMWVYYNPENHQETSYTVLLVNIIFFSTYFLLIPVMMYNTSTLFGVKLLWFN